MDIPGASVNSPMRVTPLGERPTLELARAATIQAASLRTHAECLGADLDALRATHQDPVAQAELLSGPPGERIEALRAVGSLASELAATTAEASAADRVARRHTVGFFVARGAVRISGQ